MLLQLSCQSESAYLAKAENIKDLATEIVAFNEEQRARSLQIAKTRLELLESIPEKLKPLLDDEDYMAAANLLATHTKTSNQNDGVLTAKPSQYYALLEKDNPYVVAVHQLLDEGRVLLRREYMAAKITKEEPSGADVKMIDEAIKQLKQSIIDARSPEISIGALAFFYRMQMQKQCLFMYPNQAKFSKSVIKYNEKSISWERIESENINVR